MLEGLDTIDWQKLVHAYGEATDVPGQIRALLSPDAEVRDKAHWELYGNLFHQGSRYEATPYAVPFFYELLENPTTPERSYLAYYLVNLALGYEEEYLPFGVDPEGIFSPEEQDIGEEDEGQWLNDYRNSYDAVERGVPTLVRLTEDADLAVRCAAVYALAWFPRRAEETRPVVRRVLSQAQDTDLRVNAVLSLGLLARAVNDLSDRAILESLLAETQPETVRIAAAIALATLLETALPETALMLLINTVREAGEEEAEEEEDEDEEETIRWNEGDLIGYASETLSAVSEGNEEKIVTALCSALKTAAPMSSLDITRALLSLVFKEGLPEQPPRFSQLTPLQQTAARAIGEYGGWKIEGYEFGNYSGLVGTYGLPSSHQKFLVFIAEGDRQ